VHLEVAADVLERHELGQLVCERRLDLAAVLAQHRRNPRHAERRVHVLLGPSREALAVLLAQLLRIDACRNAEDAPLVDPQALPHGARAHVHVVLLGAREVHERRAERARGHHPQVHLQAGAEQDAPLGRPGGLGAGSAAVGDEVLHDGRAVAVRLREEVHVAHRLLPPPEAARDLETLEPRRASHVLEQPADQLLHLVEPEPARAPAMALDRLEDLLAAPLSEALELLDAAPLNGQLERVDRLDVELVVELPGLLGPTPGSWTSSTSDRGTSASTSRSRSMLPVVSSSSMCAATFLPIPGSSVRSSPASTIASSERLRLFTVLTAFR
jgi:hypothetical protein